MFLILFYELTSKCEGCGNKNVRIAFPIFTIKAKLNDIVASWAYGLLDLRIKLLSHLLIKLRIFKKRTRNTLIVGMNVS